MRILDKHRELLKQRLRLDIEIRSFVNENLKAKMKLAYPSIVTERVVEICCDYLGISPETIRSKSRKRAVSNARLVISLIAHRDYRIDSAIVGDVIGSEASNIRHRTSSHDNEIFFNSRDEVLTAYQHCKILCDHNINFEYEEKN